MIYNDKTRWLINQVDFSAIQYTIFYFFNFLFLVINDSANRKNKLSMKAL